MKNRKPNRLKGYDYSQNNLYFVTNCVKNNLCCLGRVIAVGTGCDLFVQYVGRDLSVQYAENINPDDHNPDIEYVVELNEYGLIVDEKINWLATQYPYVVLHNHVVMPNHFHIILEIDSQRVKGQELKIKSLSSLMGALKTTSSNEIHETGFDDFAWHRSFHDHIIRDEKAYTNIFNYINLNPQKWFEDRFYKSE
jgi:REP element-mobilizing transposase RayT